MRVIDILIDNNVVCYRSINVNNVLRVIDILIGNSIMGYRYIVNNIMRVLDILIGKSVLSYRCINVDSVVCFIDTLIVL